MEDLPSKEEHAAFQEKVQRTVYLDNLSPQVNESVIRTALNQFGTVVSISFIPNYTIPMNIPHCALVEMNSLKEARIVVAELSNFPFMMSGMPRPVRARLAEDEMFDDRPIKPGRKIQCLWLEKNDPDVKLAETMKNLVKKHAAEAMFLLEQQLKEEEKLAKHQSETLKTNYTKYEMLADVSSDGTMRNVAKYYDMRIADDK